MKRLLAGFSIFTAMSRWILSAPSPHFKTTHLRWGVNSLRRGDFAWPLRVAPWVRNRRVLDVGCGQNLQAIGFLGAGAASYTGLDPSLKLDSTVLKDSRKRWSRKTEEGISLKDVMNARPQVRYVRATVADFARSEAGKFDLLVMHNVTEHLADISSDFAHFAALLCPGGHIVFRHPNYYTWHGHHCRPRTISEIDPCDEAQRAVFDWAHTRLRPDESTAHAWIRKTQNCIRLEELRALVSRHFTIERWEESESTKEQGIDRLTDEVLARFPEFSRRELATKAVFVVARKRLV